MGSSDRKGYSDQGLWQLLALAEAQLEQTDLVLVNLTVARGIPALADLDIDRYCRIVDGWTEQFARWLPGAERSFQQTPWKWKSDIRFFRVGMLAGFLGHEIGIRYIDEQKHAQAVRYTNPSDLFLNGLIDTRQGTCGNMAALHVAISRRMGWPVSLAAVKSHLISRYDDGEVYHNIEATTNHPGSFCSEEDSFYIKKYTLPKRAIDCGSDLRKLSMREMLGVFLALAGRHYMDTGQAETADTVYPLSRTLFPRYRNAYIGATIPAITRGKQLFDPNELGHPDSLFQDLAPMFAPHPCDPGLAQPIMNVQYITAPPLPRPSKAVVFSTGKIEPRPTKQ